MEIIKFDKVSRNFYDGTELVEALKETSFSINAGELVAVVGPSGSGKSTLLTLMGGLQSPTNGDIYFMGENIHDISKEKLSEFRLDKIGFILQYSNLIPYLTIEEQFQLVDKIRNKKFDEKYADSLMEEIDIKHRKSFYPGDLSGGEKQRAAICRALYPDPLLVLADEPTASLDTQRAIAVVKLLAKQTKKANRATVMVTHDLRLLEYCDRVFEITDGIVTEKTGEQIVH